jgi:thioredoxin reductase (NADPH)
MPNVTSLVDPLILAYAAPLTLIWLVYLGRRKWKERRSLSVRAAAVEAGLSEPASLHPKIDPALCLGCGACAKVCPEGDILGLVNGKAELIEAAECIGHGACRAACPVGAITLVFGTATRGVEIPHIGPDFQTNMPGIFIAGELGGMGLIRNAIEQGSQAIQSIRQFGDLGRPDCLDLVIVGAGPAGIAAGLGALEHKLRFIAVEQDNFGGTVAHFPRGKLVMTQPATLPLIGKVSFHEISKEKLLAFWGNAIKKTGLKIQYGERVEAVTREGDVLEVRTTRGSYRTRTVLLAIGRRGSPRRLDVVGDEMSKVVYRLVDAAQYRGQHVLVVGGGDSALEAASSIAEEHGTTVTLCYRGDALARAKQKNRERVVRAQSSGHLKVILQSKVVQIHTGTVELDYKGQRLTLENDAVIVCAGGILPTGFLKTMGVEVGTKYGTV